MADPRAELIETMSTVLDQHYALLPNSIPIAVPLAKLADAALNRLSDGEAVPKIPAYDHSAATRRRWHEPTSTLEQGLPASVGVRREDDDVVIDIHENKEQVAVWLPRQDAVEFALSILSAATRNDTRRPLPVLRPEANTQ